MSGGSRKPVPALGMRSPCRTHATCARPSRRWGASGYCDSRRPCTRCRCRSLGTWRSTRPTSTWCTRTATAPRLAMRPPAVACHSPSRRTTMGPGDTAAEIAHRAYRRRSLVPARADVVICTLQAERDRMAATFSRSRGGPGKSETDKRGSRPAVRTDARLSRVAVTAPRPRAHGTVGVRIAAPTAAAGAARAKKIAYHIFS